MRLPYDNRYLAFVLLVARVGACALPLLLSACSGNGPTTPAPKPPPAQVTWSWINGGLGVDSLYAVGVSAQRIYIACNRGMLRFDGTSWTLTELTNPEPRLRSIWSSNSIAWAVGDEGAIFHLSNGVWTSVTSPVSGTLNDVSGISGSALYACGEGDSPGTGKIIAYNGSSWTLLADAPAELLGIWAAAANDLFVVGRNGYFAHYAGGVLTLVGPPISTDLHDVWGASGTNVYAVGDDGVVRHFNGVETVNEPTGILTRQLAVAGTGASDIHVVGEAGSLLHFDGANWTTFDTGLNDRLVGVGAAVSGEAWAVGTAGTVLDYSAAQWHVRYAGTAAQLEATAFDIIVGEENGHGLAMVDADAWTTNEPLHGLAAFSAQDAYAVGDAGAIYHLAGTQWTLQTSNTSETLRGVTGLHDRFGNPMRLYAVGDAGTVRVWKGSTWSSAMLPAEASSMNFVAVWAGAIDDVFAVADNSNRVLRYDDPAELAAWTLDETPTAGTLVAVTGWEFDTYVATSLGEVLHHDGQTWKRIAQVSTPIRGMRATGNDAFYAVGDRGTLRYYESGRWSNFTADYFGNFLGVWARSGWNPVAVGTNGAVWTHVED